MPGVLTEQPPEVEGKAPPPSVVSVPVSPSDSDKEVAHSQEESAAMATTLKGEGEGGREESKGRCPFHRNSSSPESELNHSSNTSATSEGESADSKESGSDTISQDEHQGPPLSTAANEGAVEEEESPGAKEEAETTKESSEFAMMNFRLVLPGVQQPLDALVSTKDTVHDLLQFALERPECCYRTCLSVRLLGKRLDDFTELGMIEGLVDGATLELVEESYSQRDIRVHVQRLRDLLSTNPVYQSVTNTDGLTLSFLAAITLNDPEEGATRGHDNSSPAELQPPPYILPQDPSSSPPLHSPPLTPFYPPSYEEFFKIPECLKALSYSAWNPAPSHRKMKGDLLYIDITTLEGQEYYITACPTGFYLNKSTSRDNFDPTPRKVSQHSKHLVGLLSQISPLFKKNFLQLQRFGEKRHAFEVLPVPYPITPWVAPKPEHRPTNFRIDDGVMVKGAPDELIVGQLRDWNEELQTARELPADNSHLKIYRDKLIFKTHTDFIQAASQGAVAIVDGCIPALNPGDELKYRMFMWNNIFFSLAFDGKDIYQAFGGDDAAHTAACADLHGVSTYERIETKGLHTVASVIVDYRGYRVICQSIIQGLLQREHDPSVVYGSIDGGKNINADEKIAELLRKSAADLHIKEHKLLTEKDEVVTLPSSLEVKGIRGNDGRLYTMDLFRTFPPDANCSEPDDQGRSRHKMTTLRPELLESFLSYRYLLFLKLAREKACKLKVIQDLQKNLDGQSEGDKGESAPKASEEVVAKSPARETGDESPEIVPMSSDAAAVVTTSPDTATVAITSPDTGDIVSTSPDPTTVATTSPDTATVAITSPDTAAIVSTSPDTATVATMSPDTATVATTSPDTATVATTSPAAAANVTAPPTSTDQLPSEPQTTSLPAPSSPSPAVPPTEDDKPSLTSTTTTSASPPSKKMPSITIARIPSGQSSLAALSTLASTASSDSLNLLILSSENEEELLSSRSGLTQSSPEVLAARGVATPSGGGSTGPEVYLVDSMEMLTEEKEVGSEIPTGDEDGLAGSATSIAEDLEKSLNTSELVRSHPEVMEALKEAAREAGSTSAQDFTIQFNVDILAPGVRHADPEDILENDRRLVRDASSFLLSSVIPRLVRDCIQLAVTPSDGESLKQVMHSRGVNMRYLGRVAELAATRDDLQHLLRLCVSDMIVRMAKRKMRKLLQKVPLQKVSEAVAHYLNCLLGEERTAKVGAEEASVLANGQPRRKQKRKKAFKGASSTDSPHTKLTTEGLWADIAVEVGWYYRYKLQYSSLTDFCCKLGVPKVSLMRELCKKTGVQLVLREYEFSSHSTFTEDDIASMFPLVKHTDFRPNEPVALFEMAQSKFASGSIRVAHDLFVEAMQLFIQVYGPMHQDIAYCYRQIARIHYITGETVVALSYQHKAALIFERVLGVDHPDTITSYINLALYCHATNQTSAAMRLMYRARYLLLLLYGEGHPELGTCDSNIALMLLAIRDFDNSLTFLQSALRIQERYNGVESLQTAVSHHHIARVQSFLGDFRAALQHEKNAYSIYFHKLGPEHDRTKESSACLQELTEKAVTMQKTINELTGRGTSSTGRVMVELPGSWGDVANLLNATDPPARQQARGQRQAHSRPHVMRKRNRNGPKQPPAEKTAQD